MTGDRPTTAFTSQRGAFMGRLSLLFSILIAILVAIALRVWQTTLALEEQAAWVTHTQEVETRTESVLATMGTVQSDALIYATSGSTIRETDFVT